MGSDASPQIRRGLTDLVRMLLVASFALAWVGTARATTGRTPLAGPPRFHVSHTQVAPYLGKFRLRLPVEGNLISGGYVARENEFGYPEGSIVVYYYGPGGKPASWVGITYEYHAINGRMVIDVISPNNQVIFGRLNLRHLPDGTLSGVLEQLRPLGRSRQITFDPAA